MSLVPKALYDRVIIRKIEEDIDEMHGHIFVSDPGKTKPFFGEVVAVGNGLMTLTGNLIPMTLKVGDKVIYPQIGPSRIYIGKDEYISAKEMEILAVVVEEEN